MTEQEAWNILDHYASQANLVVERTMSIRELRRTFAKVFQPRRPEDDDTAMRKINPAIDFIDAERDRRELMGEDIHGEPEPQAAEPQPADPFDQEAPWRRQTREEAEAEAEAHRAARERAAEPFEEAEIQQIQREVFDRASKFGQVSLIKAWAWDGHRFRKVISAQSNRFAFDELARSLMKWLAQTGSEYPCEAVFLTEGDGKARDFILVLIKSGKHVENVMSYDLDIELDPSDPALAEYLNVWLEAVRDVLKQDQVGGC